MKAVLLLSGGLDSATLGFDLKSQGYILECLSFNYGQRHKIELTYAAKLAKLLGATHKIVDLADVQNVLKGSSLTDNSIVTPHGEYKKSNMHLTYVPNRNAILLAIAWGYACSINAQIVAAAPHSGDHYLYPDCRESFLTPLNEAFRAGSEDHRSNDLHIETPYLHITKADIVEIGKKLNVPFANTYSCYEGKETHCGLCGACHSRKQALQTAGIKDETIYID
jgi:7-cyano-7-deazaguanine synthase